MWRLNTGEPHDSYTIDSVDERQSQLVTSVGYNEEQGNLFQR